LKTQESPSSYALTSSPPTPLEGLHERLQNAPRQQANLTVTPSRVEWVLYGGAGKERRKVYGERPLAL
jgi:hypothetical protein